MKVSQEVLNIVIQKSRQTLITPSPVIQEKLIDDFKVIFDIF